MNCPMSTRSEQNLFTWSIRIVHGNLIDLGISSWLSGDLSQTIAFSCSRLVIGTQKYTLSYLNLSGKVHGGSIQNSEVMCCYQKPEKGDIFTFYFDSRHRTLKLSQNERRIFTIEENLPPETIFYPFAKLYGFRGDEIEIIHCIE